MTSITTTLMTQLAEAALHIEATESPSEGEMTVTLADGRIVKTTVASRLRNCGTLCHGVNPRTGEPSTYRYRCGMPNLCPYCAQERMKTERDRVLAATGGEVYAITASAAESKNIVRSLREANSAACYRRYPMADGMVTVLHMDPHGPGTKTKVEDLDWHALTATPDRKNISGKLQPVTPPPSEKSNEDARLVAVQHIALAQPDDMNARAFKELLEDAWELAVLKTKHLAPDLDTIELCIGARQRAFKLQLDAVGVDVRFYVITYNKVTEKDVNWQSYNDRIAKKHRDLQGMAFETMEQAQLQASLMAGMQEYANLSLAA